MLSYTSKINATLESELESSAVLIVTIILIPICTAIFVLNVLALTVLSKSKKLKKNRFHRLTLYLSISDIIASISSLFLITNLLLKLQDVHLPYICFGSTLVTSFTVLFSLVQVLFICFERLLATFSDTRVNKWNNVYGLLVFGSFVITAAYCCLIHFGFEDKSSNGCEMNSLFGKNLWKFQLSLGIVHLILFMVMLIVYGILVCRLRKRYYPSKSPKYSQTDSLSPTLTFFRRFSIGNKSNNEKQLEENILTGGRDNLICRLESNASSVSNNRAKNFHKALHTLGIIISVMIVSNLLPGMVNLMSAITTDVVSQDVLTYVNGLFLINPLCDPIIYVLRIKEFRSIITCSK
ncbi:unnamed protein product [Mytilus coruscus]|uniref:G-protein coupled receptors family 1 profile domain-containing protein n=1 Tax=Mytilus coruscus TaxID=42192 RepID=A0A6J8BZR5_MYTCO|nr:unnamed protein product [Mytilus coruscus]